MVMSQIRNLRVQAVPPNKLQIMQGDIVRVSIAFEYRGGAIGVTPYAAIGTEGWAGFDEIANNQGSVISLSESYDWLSYSGYVDIDSSPVSPDSNYDLMAKLLEYPGETEVRVLDVIDVLGAPEFRNFEITEYLVV